MKFVCRPYYLLVIGIVSVLLVFVAKQYSKSLSSSCKKNVELVQHAAYDADQNVDVDESVPEKSNTPRHKRGLHAKVLAFLPVTFEVFHVELLLPFHLTASERVVFNILLHFFQRGPPSI